MDSSRYCARRALSSFPAWRGKGSVLYHLDLELTERCNNACIHCDINRPLCDAKAQERELSTAQWREILRQAAELGVLSVRMTGGEILVREDFAELYLHARQLGMQVLLFTNARLVTRALTELWADTPPMKPIGVSVYGTRAETYERVTGVKGSYAEFRQGIALLQEYGVPFMVKTPILMDTLGELDDYAAWAAALPGVAQAPGYIPFLNLRGRRDSPARDRCIQALRVPPDAAAEVLDRYGGAPRETMVQHCKAILRPPSAQLFRCGAGKSVCVDAYGMLQPCMLLRDPDLAFDLTGGTLYEGVQVVAARIQAAKATHPDYLSRCARCFLKAFCEQCPARSWSEHGTLDTPVAYHCQVTHARARDLGLLKVGEVAWEVKDGLERISMLSEGVIH